MRAMVWKYYNRTMDGIAIMLFPVNKATRFRIGNYQIHSADLTLVFYTLAIGIGLAWYFENWLWFPATPLSIAMGWMVYGMLWGDE
jgi:hypothetical protein